MYCDWGHLTSSDHSSVKIRFSRESTSVPQVLPPIEYYSESCRLWSIAASLWPFSMGCLGSCSRTPWSPLIRRRKWLCLRKQGTLSTLSHYPLFYSDLSPVLLVTLFFPCQTVRLSPVTCYFSTITVVRWRIILSYTQCLCLSQSQLSGRVWYAGLSVSRKHQLH